MNEEEKMKHVLHLGLSYTCNMKCSHCFVDKKRDELSLEDYYRILDEAYDLGVFIIYYTYGEPLLSNKLEAVMEYAHKKGFVQILMTNGYYIDELGVEKLVNGGINKVCVSLDHSRREYHDLNRGIVGAFDKAVDAIELLVNCGIAVGIATTVNNNNTEALDEILEIAKEKKVSYISILRQRDKEIVELSAENMSRYIAFFEKCIIKNDFNVHFHDIYLLGFLHELKNNGRITDEKYERFFEMNCCHKKQTICIEPNGEVSECNLYHESIGNIKDDMLSNIIKRRNKSENSVCFSSVPWKS